MNKYQDIKHRKTLQSLACLPLIKPSIKANLSPSYKSIDFDNLLTKTQWNDIAQNTIVKVPDHSKYNSKKPAISEYSIKQNDLLSSVISPLLSESTKSLSLPCLSPKSFQFTDSNYTKLIDTINEIVSPKDSSKSKEVFENDTIDLQLLKGKIRFFWCSVKGKKSPLSLKIKKKKGKVQVFYSTSVQLPDHNHFDKIYTSDYIEIRDPSNHFRSENIYLGILAREDSDFLLSLAFGKSINSLAELKRIKMDLKLNSPINDSIYSFDSEVRKKSPKVKTGKNFIQYNKTLKLQNFDMKISILTERAENWKLKQKKIVLKKKMNLDLKKQRIVDLLKWKMTKKEREQKKIAEDGLRDKVRRFNSTWLMLVYFAKSLQTMNKLIQDSKAYKLYLDTLLAKVIFIQRIYRKFKGNLRQRDMYLLRSRNLLTLYCNNIRQLELSHLSGKVVFNFISFIAHTRLVFHHFATFQRSVYKIQRYFRRYYSRKERRLIELRKLWDHACEQLIFKKASSKSRRQELSSMIISIPSNVRDSKLLELYNSCIKSYRRDSKILDTSIKTFTQNKIFQTAISGLVVKSEFLDFVPSAKQFEKVIESLLPANIFNKE